MTRATVLFFRVGICCFGLCASSVGALAQGTAPAPLGEFGFHYAYNSLLTSESGESNQSGGAVYGQYFFRPTAEHLHGLSRFGLVGDFSGSGSGSGRLYTYMLGPRFNTEWPKAHLVLHGEYKIGGAHVEVNGVTSTGSEVSVARNGFAWGVTSGLDLLLARRYVVTLIQGDFLTTEVPDIASGGSHWRGNARFLAGIGFRFGAR